MENKEMTITVTQIIRGAYIAGHNISTEKQIALKKKYDKIKSLEGKVQELYPWQKKVISDYENGNCGHYAECKLVTNYNEDATEDIINSIEGKPKKMELKKWNKLSEKERIQMNLNARYPEAIEVSFTINL